MSYDDTENQTVYDLIVAEHRLWLHDHARRVLDYSIRLRGTKRRTGEMFCEMITSADEPRELRDLDDAVAEALAESLRVVAFAAVGLSGTVGR